DWIDPRTGALVITYDDTSNNLKQHDPSGSSAPPEQAAHTGAPVVVTVRQNGGVGMFGRPVTGPSPVGTSLSDKRRDGAFDPIYSTKNIPQLDLRHLSVKRTKKQLLIRLSAATLSRPDKAISATSASDIDYVARRVGPA